jgi:hypothetical protein
MQLVQQKRVIKYRTKFDTNADPDPTLIYMSEGCTIHVPSAMMHIIIMLRKSSAVIIVP